MNYLLGIMKVQVALTFVCSSRLWEISDQTINTRPHHKRVNLHSRI